MKKLLAVITVVITALQLASQSRVAKGESEITREQYESCKQISYLQTNPQILKKGIRLSLPIAGREAKVFVDDTTVRNYYEYNYIGDIKNTKLTIVKGMSYNEEEFYIVNRLTGSIDTLIGLPVFASNMIDFACINNPATDQNQRIQFCEIKNGKIKTRIYIKLPDQVFLVKLSCINRNNVSAEDNKGKYREFSFRIDKE
jgi:hypothetical protein